MLKLIYIARRKPGYTFDEFVRRWRMHGALGMSQPLWRHATGYVQAEPILPAPIAGASEDFDAVATLTLRTSMRENMTHEDVAGAMAMAEDELETFSAPIPSTSLWVREECIRAAEPGGITAFLFFMDTGAAGDVSRRALERDGLSRITLNLRDDAVLGRESNTLPYAAVVELSACSVPALSGAIAARGRELIGAADLVVVTREAVLWNRLAAG